ncbi:hypothetical protein HHI36_015481 [Cryptolaemus montrouzieri]|uniref:Uncharacterized protein n=1 Tax=Cryptolaemus montrouzieri TaxID=559131 RepID=A0ABD2N6K4_9CUCU
MIHQCLSPGIFVHSIFLCGVSRKLFQHIRIERHFATSSKYMNIFFQQPNSAGKETVLGNTPQYLIFHSSKESFHADFNGLKLATSKGCKRCVELGGRRIKRISFSSHF